MALGFVEAERWKKDFDHDWMCIYRKRDGTTQLRRCPWWFTSEGHVANMQHIGSCSMFPRTPGLSGWSFQLLRVSGNKDIALKTDIILVSISSADKDTEKIFDGFNRMHMIWTDRFEKKA